MKQTNPTGSAGLSEDERTRLTRAIHGAVSCACDPVITEVERIVAAREAAARAEGLTDTADELWRIFLRLPYTPSPLGDYIQRRVAEFHDRAARIARGEQ